MCPLAFGLSNDVAKGMDSGLVGWAMERDRINSRKGK